MDLDRAVTATIAYATFFRFPLFPDEIYHWLIFPRRVSLAKLKPHLSRPLSPSEERFRKLTTRYTEEKISHAQKLVGILKYFPGLRLIALTGSVAARNPQKNDDIDLMFITSPHTLWLIRPFVIGLISLFFRRRHPEESHAHAPNAFCPNLWLDGTSLSIPDFQRSLYTAHEVLQIVPLLDRGDTYQHFIQANRWTNQYLANAYAAITGGKTLNSVSTGLFVLFFPFNYLFYLLQLFYMSPKKTSEVVHLHGAFLHTTDFSSKLDTHLKSLNNI